VFFQVYHSVKQDDRLDSRSQHEADGEINNHLPPLAQHAIDLFVTELWRGKSQLIKGPARVSVRSETILLICVPERCLLKMDFDKFDLTNRKKTVNFFREKLKKTAFCVLFNRFSSWPLWQLAEIQKGKVWKKTDYASVSINFWKFTGTYSTKHTCL